MGSFISWLDHSEEDQRRVREMLQLFSDKDTVDDLGLGTVRDAISNALFPGTSVIQTRARYFLFIPWIFRRAERRHPHQLVAKATDMERSAHRRPQRGRRPRGPDRRRRRAKRPHPPLGDFLGWAHSLRHLPRAVPEHPPVRPPCCRGLAAADTEDEIGDRAPAFWQREIPDAPPDFFSFKSANFELTRNESEWLCERIISSDRSAQHESLLTAYVKDLRRGRPLGAVDAVWDATLPTDTAEAIARLVHHAEHFSCAAHGAALLYNLELAEERRRTGREETDATSRDDYRERLDEWRAHARRVRLATWAENIDDFWDCILDQGARIPPRTRRFVDEWAGFLASDTANIASSATARTLVHDRELEHKRGQARLANRKRLDDWAGNAGTAPLAFRWTQVQRMLTDIADGLNATESDDKHAVA